MPDHSLPFRRSPPVATLVLLALALSVYAGLHVHDWKNFQENKLNFYLEEPLMTTPDAYFYLRLTRDLLTENYAPRDSLRSTSRPTPAPLLARLTSGLTQLLGASMERTAFFLPPVLLVAGMLLLWVMARDLFHDSLIGPFIAVMALASSFVLYRRSVLGYFDTDGMNLFFAWLLIFCVYRFATADRRRILWAAGWLLTAAGAYLWWERGAAILVGVSVVAYAASFPLRASRWERMVKLCLLGMIFAGAGFAFVGTPGWFPEVLQRLSNQLEAHAALIFRIGPEATFHLGDTIEELSSPSFQEAVVDLAGWLPVLLISAVGFLWGCLRNRKAAAFLLAPVVCYGLLCLGGRRFLMFLAPAYALGLGFFVVELSRVLIRRHVAFRLSVATLGLTLVIPGFLRCVHYQPQTTFDRNDATLVSSISRHTPKDSKLWNWWGPGYFLQYFSNRPTLFDGGQQEPLRTYIAAAPLASNDATFARFWMKFFSEHPKGLRKLGALLGSLEEADSLLHEVFTSPENATALLANSRLPQDRDWLAYLFPDSEVYVVLLSDMLIRGTWLYLGKEMQPDPREFQSPIYMLPWNSARLDMDAGVVHLNDKELPFGVLFEIAPKQLAQTLMSSDENVLLHIPDARRMYYTKRRNFGCLAFSLLFVYPEDTLGFHSMAYNPFVGGVWRLK